MGVLSFWAFIAMLAQVPSILFQTYFDKVAFISKILIIFFKIVYHEEPEPWKCDVLDYFLLHWTARLRFNLLLPLFG